MLIALGLSLLLIAQTSAPASVSPEQQRANDLFQAQDWAGAAKAYADLVKSTPSLAQPHFRLAVALINLSKYQEAVGHLKEAEKLGTPPVQVALRLAVAHAHAGDRDAAFRELNRAIGLGLTALPPPLDSDSALASLRSDPRYKEFATALDRNARPCEHDPKYRELDFWIGEWDARGANAPPNTPPSSSVITKIHTGCVILESWSSPGYTGQSFNIYDRSRGKWHQTWVDSTGGLHEYWGELKGANMIYEGQIPPLPGMSPQQTRMTFFNLGPDKVRQLVERSADGGKTWQVNYDISYTRRQ
jgi:tetratricopeptide (TPR) repeat protein